MEELSVVTVVSNRMPDAASGGDDGGDPPDAGARLGAAAGSPADRRAAALDGRTRQQCLLLMVPITPDPKVLSSLEGLLCDMAKPPDMDFKVASVIPFRKLTGVHFAR